MLVEDPLSSLCLRITSAPGTCLSSFPQLAKIGCTSPAGPTLIQIYSSSSILGTSAAISSITCCHSLYPQIPPPKKHTTPPTHDLWFWFPLNLNGHIIWAPFHETLRKASAVRVPSEGSCFWKWRKVASKREMCVHGLLAFLERANVSLERASQPRHFRELPREKYPSANLRPLQCGVTVFVDMSPLEFSGHVCSSGKRKKPAMGLLWRGRVAKNETTSLRISGPTQAV